MKSMVTTMMVYTAVRGHQKAVGAGSRTWVPCRAVRGHQKAVGAGSMMMHVLGSCLREKCEGLCPQSLSLLLPLPLPWLRPMRGFRGG